MEGVNKMTNDTARVIAQKINELEGMFGAHKVLCVRQGRDNKGVSFEVQVKGFANVPDNETVIYEKRKDAEYPYQKSAVVNSVMFLAIGTIEDMQKEFKQETE